MTERTTEYDRYDSLPSQIIKGNFTLHVPSDPTMIPGEFPVQLASREYEHVHKDDLPILHRANLVLHEDDETGIVQFVGSIDFDTPTSCLSRGSSIAGVIEKRLHLQLRNAHDEKHIARVKRGVLIVDPLRPMIWAGITRADRSSCHLEMTAPFDPTITPADRLADIQSVAEQWVELQEMIVQLAPLPFQSPYQHHVYLDIDTTPRASEIEFAFMEVLADYGEEARAPQWGTDIDSRVLSTLERYAENRTSLELAARSLVAIARELHEATGYMQPLDQGTMIGALLQASRSRLTQSSVDQ